MAAVGSSHERSEKPHAARRSRAAALAGKAALRPAGNNALPALPGAEVRALLRARGLAVLAVSQQRPQAAMSQLHELCASSAVISTLAAASIDCYSRWFRFFFFLFCFGEEAYVHSVLPLSSLCRESNWENGYRAYSFLDMLEGDKQQQQAQPPA